jgi:cytochrome o ubiquinol oxidase subunit 1
MLGKLTWSAIPFAEPLPLLSGAVVGIVILTILGTVTVKGWWPVA